MRRAIVIPAILAACIAVACASGGVPPRETSDDCLVLIRTMVENPSALNNARRYYVTLNDGQKRIKLPDQSKGILAIKIREPGIRIVAISSDVDQSQATGNSFDSDVDLPLPYKPGEIAVADFLFVHKLMKSKIENMVLSDFDFREANPDAQAILLQEFLENEKKAKDWQ